MSLLYYEIRKMFIHHKGLLLVALYFLFSIGSLLLFNTAANPEMERNRTSYDYYLQRVEGPCSKETEKFLSEESNRISEAESTLQKTYDDYYNGKVSEDDFNRQAGTLKETLRHKDGFELIYGQYTQIRENTGNRYFLYTNGWDGLLSNDNLDLPFVLLLLLLVTPVFCYEYESRMDCLMLTERKGTRSHALCKIGLALFTVILLCLLSSGMQYIFNEIKYGLPHGDYPLQSLSYFNTSSENITLLGTFLEASAGKIFGFLCFAVLIMFMSVCVKKYALTLFTSSAAILLPYFGFSLQSSKYFLPGPLGFMIFTGFLRGSEYQLDASTQEKLMVFQEISVVVRTLLLIVTLCIAAAMLAVILLKNTNVWCAKTRRCSMKRPLCLILALCAIVSGLSGCAAPKSQKSHSVYNLELKESFENQEYRFYTEPADSGERRIVFKNKKNGDVQSLVRDPMQSLTKVPECFYGDGEYIYYLKYDLDESEFWGGYNSFSVIRVNTRNFSECVIFERNLNTKRDSFLGLGQTPDLEAYLFILIEAFFVDDHSLYFIGQDQIRRIDRLTGQMEVIVASPVLKTVAFDGRTIYYIDSESKVIQFDTVTNTETELPGIVTSSFLLTDDEMIFINRKDQNKLYVMSRKDNSIQKILDESVLSFTLDGGTIVYISKSDTKEHRIDLDTLSD